MIERSSARRDSGVIGSPVLDLVEHGVFTLSASGVVESWSRGALRLTGRRAPEVVGAAFATLFWAVNGTADDAPARLIREASRLGRAAHETWLARAGEGPFWGRLTLSAIGDDEAHEPERFVAVLRDAGEERRGAAARDRLRTLVEALDDHAVLAASLDGVIEDWDRGARRLLARSAEEVVGQPLATLFPLEVRESDTPARLVREARSRGIASFEGWLPRPGGGGCLAAVTLALIEDAGGRARGLLVIVRDITARRHEQDALRESEARFQQLLDSLPDYGVFMLSADGRVMSWGAGAERLKGYRAEEVIGSTLEPFFMPEDRAAGLAKHLLTRAAEEGRAEFEGSLARAGRGSGPT